MPAIEQGKPCASIRIPAGPATGALPTIGLTAATLPRARVSASRTPGTARMGPILVIGLLGAISTASAAVIASTTPGAGSASDAPAKRTELTGSWYHRCTKYSSKLNSPVGVSTRVSTRELLIGRMQIG